MLGILVLNVVKNICLTHSYVSGCYVLQIFPEYREARTFKYYGVI